jgi:hypothetical protein
MPALSRRALFALGSAGLLLPRRLLAGTLATERKFLFVFCPGGWDVTGVYAPVFNDTTDHLAGDEAATAGGFTFSDSPSRPSVRAFFESWGPRACLINGYQVPSVAHDVCTRWTMTGTANDGSDDWTSIIAGKSAEVRVMPNVHVSGPIYPHAYVNASVRVGLASQLATLVDGSALLRSDTVVPPLSPSRDALEEAFVRARLDRWAAAAPAGMPARVAAAEQLAMDRAAALVEVADDLRVDGADLYGSASVIVRALAGGLARTGIVAYGSGGNGAWDTHSGNDYQTVLFETLFGALDQVLADLAAAPGEKEPTLLDETTVVVLSEMGRTPQLNAAGGKDHWTWTSALLVGGGVAGGRTIGAWTDKLTGSPVDLATGEASAAGVTLLPGHIGATLLALADVDPAEFIDPSLGEAIEAVLD